MDFKKWFNIDGVSVGVKITSVDSIHKKITGIVILRSKSEKQVGKVEVKLHEYFSKGFVATRPIFPHEYQMIEMGKITLSDAFVIKKDEERQLPFVLPYIIEKPFGPPYKEAKVRKEFIVTAIAYIPGTILDAQAQYTMKQNLA